MLRQTKVVPRDYLVLEVRVAPAALKGGGFFVAEKDRYYTEIIINGGDPLRVVEPAREVDSRYGNLIVGFSVTDQGSYEVLLDTSGTANLGKRRGLKRVQVTEPRHSHRADDQSHAHQDSYRSGIQQLGRGDVVFVRTNVPQEVYRSNSVGRT